MNNGLVMLESLKEWRGIAERLRLPNVAISFTLVQLDLLTAALELAESCRVVGSGQVYGVTEANVYRAYKGKL